VLKEKTCQTKQKHTGWKGAVLMDEVFIYYLTSYPNLDNEMRLMLEEMNDDEIALEDAFYKNLEFGIMVCEKLVQVRIG
jgi:hypothetical protein